MKYFIWITTAVMFIYIIYKSSKPWRKKRACKKAAKEYTGRTVGKVIGTEKDIRTDFFARFLTNPYNRGWAKRNYTYYMYSSVIEYEVNGITYTVDALDYSILKPVTGRRALVMYDEDVPSKACVWTYRKYKKPLEIWAKDEEYLYCSCGLKKEIKIPVVEAEDRARPGYHLVNKYGFYFVEQPEDRKQSAMEMINEVPKALFGENEEWENYNK